MFDPFAQTLFGNLPDFTGLNADEARRALSRAYLAVIELRTNDAGPTDSAKKVIKYLRRLADTMEFYAVLDDSVEEPNRRAGAFIVGESLALLCQLMLRAPEIRFLLMSAMVQNPDELAKWLETATGFQAKTIQVPWRPTRTLRSALGVDRKSAKANYKLAETRLKQLSERRKNEKFNALYSLACGLQGAWQSTNQADYGIVQIPCEAALKVSRKKTIQGKWIYSPVADKWVNGSATRIASFLAEHKIQTLVFIPTSKHYPFSNAAKTTLSPDTRQSLCKLPSSVKICRLLAEYEFGMHSDVFHLLDQGISVHTSHMLESEKIASEAAFRARATRIMFATGTLAQGLNLPATAVVIAGTRIGDPRGQDTDVVEQRKLSQLLNAAGRAGRAGFANQGLVIAVPDEPYYLNDYEELKDIKKELGYLQQADNAVEINSGLESFLDQVAKGILSTETATEVELQTIAVLAGGDQVGLPPFLNHERSILKWNQLFLFPAIDTENRHSC